MHSHFAISIFQSLEQNFCHLLMKKKIINQILNKTLDKDYFQVMKHPYKSILIK